MKVVTLWWTCRQMNSKSPTRVSKAAKKLGALKHHKSVFPLCSLLEHPSESVRQAAALALQQIGDVRAIVPLVMALQDDDQRTRQAVQQALVSFGKPAVPQLIATTKSDNHRLRVGALGALGLMHDHTAVVPLIDALADRTPDVREAAAVALGEVHDQRALMPLLLSLQDEHEACRSAAQRALARYGSLASPHLLEALNRGNEIVRTCAIRAIGAIKDFSAIPALTDALNDSSALIRKAALVALIRIGDESVLPRVKRLWDDDDRDFRREVFDALEDMARAAVKKQDWTSAIACRDAAVRPVIETVFGQIQKVQSVKTRNPGDLAWIPQALQTLVVIGDIKAIPFLLKLVGEPDVSEVALIALEKWLRESPIDFSDEQLRELASLEQVAAWTPHSSVNKVCDCAPINRLARRELHVRSDSEHDRSKKPSHPEPQATPIPESPLEPAARRKPRIVIHDDIHLDLPADLPTCSFCSRPIYKPEDPNVRLFIAERRLEDHAFVRQVRKTVWLMERLDCPQCKQHFCWECAVKHVHESGAPSPGDGLEWCPGCTAKLTVHSRHRQQSQRALSPQQKAKVVEVLLQTRDGERSADGLAFVVAKLLIAQGWNGVDAYFGRLYSCESAKLLDEQRISVEQLLEKVKAK